MIINLIEVKIQEAIEKMRPPIDIRNQLDLGFTFKNNVVLFFEIRPSFRDPKEIMHHSIAKIKYVKTKNIWKLYWMRGNLTWLEYHTSDFSTVENAFKVIKADKEGCFFG